MITTLPKICLWHIIDDVEEHEPDEEGKHKFGHQKCPKCKGPCKFDQWGYAYDKEEDEPEYDELEEETDPN